MAIEQNTYEQFQQQKASQLSHVTSATERLQGQVEQAALDSDHKDPYWSAYRTSVGKIDWYPVTPHTVWGMMRIRKALAEDLVTPQSAWEVAQQFLNPRGESK